MLGHESKIISRSTLRARDRLTNLPRELKIGELQTQTPSTKVTNREFCWPLVVPRFVGGKRLGVLWKWWERELFVISVGDSA